MAFMSLDEQFRERFDALAKARGDSVNAVAKRAQVAESTIRALLNEKTRSATLATVEKLAGGLNVTPAALLGLEAGPVNADLLAELVKRLLRSFVRHPQDLDAIARSVAQSYTIALRNGVDPRNPREIDLLTSAEVDRLRREGKSPKS